MSRHGASPILALPLRRMPLSHPHATFDEVMVRKQYRLIIAVPPLLIASMYGAFRFLTAWLGFPAGYLAAFGLYWIGWCVIVPIENSGHARSSQPVDTPDRTLRPVGSHDSHVALVASSISACLLVCPANRVDIVGHRRRVGGTGGLTGVTEELLWRGVFVTGFPNRLSLNTIYPSIAFGLWHLCPMSALPSRYPGGPMSFAAYAVALGLSYAFCARRTESIRWCTVSHCIHDALGLGALAYASWLN